MTVLREFEALLGSLAHMCTTESLLILNHTWECVRGKTVIVTLIVVCRVSQEFGQISKIPFRKRQDGSEFLFHSRTELYSWFLECRDAFGGGLEKAGTFTRRWLGRRNLSLALPFTFMRTNL